MAKKSKFDAVTIGGVALALAMLIGGQMWVRDRQTKYEAYRQQQAALEQAAIEAKLEREKSSQKPSPADETTKSEIKTPNGPVETKKEKPLAEPEPEPEPQPAPNVTVKTPALDLVFTARGATLESATLADEYTDPANKSRKGLEILAEIQPGRRTLGLPMFDIGTADPEKQKERILCEDKTEGALKSLDNRIWNLDFDSKAFDASGNWKLVYSITLKDQYTLTKAITVNNNKNGYIILCDIGVLNNSAAPAVYIYSLNGPAGILLDSGGNYSSVMAELAGRETALAGQPPLDVELKQVDPGTAAKELDGGSAISNAENLWGAVKNRFYMAALISLDPAQLIKLKAVPIKHDFSLLKDADPHAADFRYAAPNAGIQGIRRRNGALAPGKSGSDHYALYIGPTDAGPLDAAEKTLSPTQPLQLSEAIHYFSMANWNWPRVDWLARQMLWLFKGLYWIFGSYGVAVILLTLIIKSALHPLQRKMMVSMSKMAKLQPEIKKIQAKYKGQTGKDVQAKMYLEQQNLMKSAGANPVAGCLPMFIQMPIFMALYGVFCRAFEMRGAQFWWIKDLSQEDNLMSLPFYPHVLNLLPLIYMGMTVVQTRLSPTPKSDDPQQEMSRKMMMFMPLFISLMFYHMPSGLVLYFAASAVFGSLESWYIKKHLLKDPPGSGAPAAKGSSGAKTAGAKA